MIFNGKPGRGKTHLAIAIAYRAIQHGFDALFVTAAELIDDLSAAFRAGRFAAALGTYTHPSVLVVDVYTRFVASGARAGTDDRRQLIISRAATVLFGATGTLLATNVSRIGTLLEIANKLVNAFAGPLFGIYLLAMFSRRAGSTGTLAAGLAGTFTSYYVAYHTSIGFMWPSTFGLAATLLSEAAFGVVLSERPSADALRLTWRNVMARPEPLEADGARAVPASNQVSP